MNGKNKIHGGAERVRFKHQNAMEFFQNVCVSIKSFPLSENQNPSFDWRQKGECVKHEYVSFANYIDRYGELPEFNDQDKSRKK
ncbi:MAG: hypothetical protein KAI40_09050 [Desulfobacterales bacterium]|nr:hypothetical protein [Desulfobacterales bacterium]